MRRRSSDDNTDSDVPYEDTFDNRAAMKSRIFLDSTDNHAGDPTAVFYIVMSRILFLLQWVATRKPLPRVDGDMIPSSTPLSSDIFGGGSAFRYLDKAMHLDRLKTMGSDRVERIVIVRQTVRSTGSVT